MNVKTRLTLAVLALLMGIVALIVAFTLVHATLH
jgi:hypothetical protein